MTIANLSVAEHAAALRLCLRLRGYSLDLEGHGEEYRRLAELAAQRGGDIFAESERLGARSLMRKIEVLR